MPPASASTCRGQTLCAPLLGAVLVLSGCGEDAVSPPEAGVAEERPAARSHAAGSEPPATEAARWYAPAHVERGAAVYAANCAVCHGAEGEGEPDWRKRDADGNLPPPPLNGTAHTWHHPIRALATQIKFGTPGGQGVMPGFAETLSDQQVVAVIAWIQSRWPDEVYAQWAEIERRSRKPAR